jgi:hypothetical protein
MDHFFHDGMIIRGKIVVGRWSSVAGQNRFTAKIAEYAEKDPESVALAPEGLAACALGRRPTTND